jgi:hypothetical protein
MKQLVEQWRRLAEELMNYGAERDTLNDCADELAALLKPPVAPQEISHG